MSCAATLAKTTKDGTLAIWNFYINDEKTAFICKNNSGKEFSFTTIDSLRKYYSQMIQWGFSPFAFTDTTATEIAS